MSPKGGLGKGLNALIPDSTTNGGTGENLIAIEKIIPNPRQPRRDIDPNSLQELADSIREHGILQPLIVTQNTDHNGYTLIAGERRLQAARMAGLTLIPVIVRQATDQERLELALIENIQRADLTPLETAEAFQQLNEFFQLSHEEIAARVGKSRVTVTNTLRLLKLPDAVKVALTEEKISEGHARALLGLPTPQAQLAALQSILQHGLTVRQTEELVRRMTGEKIAKPAPPPQAPEIRALQDRLCSAMGTKVTLKYGKKGGTITIHYYSQEELDAIIQRIAEE
jgi:ParB family chromosome partitioning protein